MCEGPRVWRQQQRQGPAAVTLDGRPCPHPGSSGPSPASPACGWPARGGQGTSTTLSLAVHSVTRPVLTLGTVSNPRLLEEVLFVYVLKYRIFLIQGKASGCHLKTHLYSCLSVYLARAMCRWPAGRGGEALAGSGSRRLPRAPGRRSPDEAALVLGGLADTTCTFATCKLAVPFAVPNPT